eukprot:123680-Prymnesium_polylepis.1
MTGLSGWGKAYQTEPRPTTYMSIDLKILIPPKTTHRSIFTQESEDCVRTRIMFGRSAATAVYWSERREGHR